ncbi:diacylglycerol kinase family protein [Streptomyces sp. NPDC006654]|uniref:diacylglycerol/lipid kinase family protein n=1 Tax=Streptomyces sp. NPDC006654 TaxID=3156897 RepID=UPI0033D9866A
MNPQTRLAPRSDRPTALSWARVALLALLGSLLVLLVSGGLRSLLWVLVAIAAVALAAGGLWWTLAHPGPLRAAGALLAAAAPVAALVLFATHGMLVPACLALGLWLLALTAARIATTPADRAAGSAGEPVAGPPARQPWVVMNPRSGGGKVTRFGLAEKARAAGARVVLLDPAHHQDVAELARRALAEGADLLAVAGGDGTQALVAEVAARHDVPFVVIPAGTRNHFALDLGLDRDDPAAALEAFTDAEEVRVDLGYAAGRVFVNNASFGTYAAVVGNPGYRDAKLRTVLQMLPTLLTGPDAPRLSMRAGRRRARGLQAVLVSNNPYRPLPDPARPGFREGLDSGRLGVLGVCVDSPGRAARLLTWGRRSPAVTSLTAREVVVDADTRSGPASGPGAGPASDTGAVPGPGPGANADAGPGSGPGTDADAVAGAGRGADAGPVPGAGRGADAGPVPGADPVDADADAGSVPGPGTDAGVGAIAAVGAAATPDVGARGGTVPAGIDGESVVLPAPVVCRISPGALRVRVPRHRPGTPPNRPPADWRRVLRLALTPRGRRTGSRSRG